MASKNIVAIYAKMLGGRKIVQESDDIRRGLKRVGETVKETDKTAGSSTGGVAHYWGFFKKEARNAEKQAQHTHSFIKNVFSTALGFAGGQVGITGIKDLIGGAQELGESAMQFSSMSGMGYQGAVQYNAAFKALGVGAEAGSKSMRFLSKNMETGERQERKYQQAQEKNTYQLERKKMALEKAEQSGKAWAIASARMAMNSPKHTVELGKQAEAFHKLGLTITGLRKMGPEKMFETLFEKISKLPPGMQKTQIAMQLLGRGSGPMLRIFNQGEYSLKHFHELAQKLFPTLKGGSKTFEDMRVKMGESSMAWESIRYTLGMKLAPVLSKVSMWFAKVAVAIKSGKGVWGELGSVVHWIVETGKNLINFFKQHAWAMEILKPLVVGFVAAWVAFKAIKLVGELAKTVAELAEMGIAMGPWIIAIAAVSVAAYMLIKHWKEVSRWVTGAISDVGNFIAKWGPKVLEWILEFFVPAVLIIKNWDAILKFFGGLAGKVGNIFKGIGEALWAGIKWGIDKVIEGLEWIIHAIGVPGFSIGPIHFGGFHPFSGVHIPKLAEGGWIRKGGTVVVGDRGPELLSLPPGARVDPLASSRTANLLPPGHWNAGSSGDLIVSVQIDRREIGRAVLQEFNAMEARRA